MGLNRKHLYYRLPCFSAIALLLAGCVSDFSFTNPPGSSGTGSFNGAPTGPTGSGNGDGDGSGGGKGSYPSTPISVRSFKPALAIRGINCLLCHGNIGSNVVTDFGHNADANGLQELDKTSDHFFGPNRTAFNDTEDGTPIGGWQTGSISGNIYVPSEPIAAAQSQSLFGVNSALTFAQIMGVSSTSNSLGVVAPVPSTPMNAILKGSGSVVSLPLIRISYPSQAQIQGAAGGASVAAPAAVPVGNSSSVSGLNASSANTFVRNGSAASPDAVNCNGDIAVVGPLFLKNATINTSDQGCRIYATGVIMVQGPLTVQGSTNANLQLSSAKAILFGFDLLHLGYAFGTNGSNLRSQYATSLALPDSKSFIRFSMGDDTDYYPSGHPQGFASTQAFFDSIVADAVLIDGGHLDSGKTGPSNWSGSELVDAFTATQPSSAYVQTEGGYRLAYEYSHVLLNAPQIHGRYGGAINGVIIGDDALFLLSGDASSSSGLGVNFSYDPIFDNVTQMLPLFPNIFTVGP